MVNSGHQFISPQAIARQKALAEMMLKQGQQPLEAPQSGRLAAPISPLAVLGSLVNSYFGASGLRKAGEMEEQREQQLSQDYAQGIQEYLRRSQGGQEVDLEGQLGPDGSVPMKDVPGDRRGALLQAMMSQNPRLQEFAQKEWERLGDTREVGGVLYDPMTMETQQLQGRGPQLERVGGDLYERNPTTGALKKLDNAPKTTVNVSGPSIAFPKSQTKLAEAMGTNIASDVQESAVAAQGAQRLLATLDRMEEIGEGYSGPLATFATRLGQLGSSLGLAVDTEKLANSESMASEAMQLWLAVTGSLEGGMRGITEIESNEIRNNLPTLLQTPEGRQRVFGNLRRAALDGIETGRIKQEAAINAMRAGDEGLYYEALSQAQLPTRGRRVEAETRAAEREAAPQSKVRRYNPETGRIE